VAGFAPGLTMPAGNCQSSPRGSASRRQTSRTRRHRAVMEVMVWSQMAMTTRYQHLALELARGIADQVAGLLWKTN
jgi:hypothetical protein